jgi:hypothetical protein
MSLSVIISALQPSGNLLGRFQAQLLIESGVILSEDSEVTNHTNRVTLANKLLASDTFLLSAASRLRSRALAVNTTAQAKGNDLTDGEIEYIIRSTQLTDQAIVTELNAL